MLSSIRLPSPKPPLFSYSDHPSSSHLSLCILTSSMLSSTHPLRPLLFQPSLPPPRSVLFLPILVPCPLFPHSCSSLPVHLSPTLRSLFPLSHLPNSSISSLPLPIADAVPSGSSRSGRPPTSLLKWAIAPAPRSCLGYGEIAALLALSPARGPGAPWEQE